MADKINNSIILIPIGLIMYALYKALPHDNTDFINKPDQISKNFNMSEFSVTNTGLPNTIPSEQKAWIIALVQEILQPLRDIIGSITITSGYRSTEVNTRIGGSPYSQHMLGQASDIISSTKSPKEIFLTLYNSTFPIKQCILYAPTEGNFVHVSIDPKRPAKREFLIMESGVFTPYNGGEIIL
jgi:zinc D-Ala-D-Ala carboxypeptidase